MHDYAHYSVLELSVIDEQLEFIDIIFHQQLLDDYDMLIVFEKQLHYELRLQIVL